MKKQRFQRPQQTSRPLRQAEPTAIAGGGKVMHDGAFTDDEYAAWGVDIKDQPR